MYYFCYRGRGNLREVQKDDFDLGRDGQGRKYVTIKVKRQTKNHKGDSLAHVDNKDGLVYELPGKFLGSTPIKDNWLIIPPANIVWEGI